MTEVQMGRFDPKQKFQPQQHSAAVDAKAPNPAVIAFYQLPIAVRASAKHYSATSGRASTGSPAAFHSGYPSSSLLALKPRWRSLATASNASTQ